MSTINLNLLPSIQNTHVFYFLAFGILFLIIAMLLIFFDVNLTSFGKSKSKEEIIKNTFIILFFCLLLFGLCVIFIPKLRDLKTLFEQIGNVTYFIVYTIFAILFYSLTSKDILNSYSYIINPVILILGAFSFYKSITDNYVEKFDVNYERIKMLIMFFCLITFAITFYNINPGGDAEKYFGYSLLLTIIISVFVFLYIVVLLALPGEKGKTQANFMSNFSSIGVYGTILFFVFLIIITTLISVNKESFFANKEKSSSVIILLLIICILWSLMLGGNLFANIPAPETSKINLFKKSLLVLFGLIISGLLIYWITYNIQNLSGNSNITSFILNVLLVVIILGLIYKTFYVKLPVGNTKKNAFFNLLLSTIFYIPCLVTNIFDWISQIFSGSYTSDGGSFLMLITVIVLIIAYFKVPSVFNFVSTQGGEQLVNKPVSLDTEYNLGNYIDLNKSDVFDYQYGISCWIYIDSVPPNTNASYNKFTSLLNFGNKPNILYNGTSNTLMITMQQKNLKDVTKNKLTDFDSKGNRIIYTDTNFLLQKWNNIIINYNGGTLDIFMNGKLVKSSIEVVPYYTFDNLTIGEKNGIKGGICNVIYFRKALTSQNIYYLYNTVKDRTPPILNDSNETILVKNINQTIDSSKEVAEKE